MTLRNTMLLPVMAALAVLWTVGCERDTSGLKPVPADDDPVVFSDTFGKGVDFQAFMGSKVDAVAIDQVEKYQGSAVLEDHRAASRRGLGRIRGRRIHHPIRARPVRLQRVDLLGQGEQGGDAGRRRPRQRQHRHVQVRGEPERYLSLHHMVESRDPHSPSRQTRLRTRTVLLRGGAGGKRGFHRLVRRGSIRDGDRDLQPATGHHPQGRGHVRGSDGAGDRHQDHLQCRRDGSHRRSLSRLLHVHVFERDRGRRHRRRGSGRGDRDGEHHRAAGNRGGDGGADAERHRRTHRGRAPRRPSPPPTSSPSSAMRTPMYRWTPGRLRGTLPTSAI